MTLVCINGEFVDDPAKATLSAFDAGVQHAVGLFETMLALPPRESDGAPRIHRLGEHLSRLETSIAALGLTQTFRPEAMGDLLVETARRYGCTEGRRARMRLTVTGGDLNLLRPGSGSALRPTILIVCQEPTEYPQEMFELGVSAVIADLRVNPLDPFESHKTLSYWRRLNALRDAAAKGAGEAIVFQVSNHVAGGAVSNIFAVRKGTLQTPIARGEETAVARSATLPSPVLPGVTRLAVIEHAASCGIEVVRKMMTIDDVLDADEVFLTNSSWGVLPVTRVEGRSIGAGTPGEWTRCLRACWLAELDQSSNADRG
ncbi:MAG: aminotransferase class IV family protein [Phycisphaeraceae bacterium]|nr:aminotransferase class IV family protein [Phycisphaeraceae bacterium]